ncbi:MAG: efflux RND transporter permease subunit, partial [Gemmatimonadaceae bacterium]|nr:efflux RND transporter permease subunit [Gemmatimonadaceae bacterium]
LAGQWFRPFALTIAASVLVSLFVSFSLDPMLSAYWADPHVPPERRGWLTRTLDRFNAWFDRLADRYRRGIGWALDHPKSMVTLAIGTLVAAVVLQATLGGAGFTPVSDNSELNVSVEVPPGSSLAYTRVASERVATQEREISQQALATTLRRELRAIGGSTAYVLEAGGPGGGQKQLQLQLQGEEARTLGRLAAEVRDVMARTPGAVDVGLSSRGEKPELRVSLDRGLAAQLGVSVGQVAQAIRPAFAGVDAGTWIDPGGETRYVRVRLAPETRESPADLARLPIVLPPGTGGAARPPIVPLGQIAAISASTGPSQIEHLDRARVVTVGANVEGGSLNEVLGAVNRRIADEVRFPPGYRIVQGGQVESQQEVFGGIITALGIAVLLMYLILVVQFGSFLDPLAILLSLPLSLIGVVLALLITGDTLNIMSLIGVILLMGIVAKNAILLVDFAKWGVERGMPIRDALVEAGATRLRPILMTTLALIAGMIPVALGLGEGADFRAPLGRAVIGGTITSTALTLFVIPTIYELFDRLRTRLARRFVRSRETTGAADERLAPVAGD